MFDVVILGAGPAGSAAAVVARRHGLSVALIDKASFPRDKLCGGLVSGRGLAQMDAAFGARPGPDSFLISQKVEFRWGSERLHYFDAANELHFIRRLDLDHWAFGQAVAAGAVAFTDQHRIRIEPGENTATLEDGAQLGYRVLIGADGVNSQVARMLFGRAFDAEKVGFALEAEAPRDDGPDGPVMAVDFIGASWGYGWSFPKQASRTIGVGGIQGRNPDLKACLARLLADEGVDPGAVKIKGAFIPFGEFRRKPGQGNVLLAGDAAGLADPLTGEGIAYAFESGRYAAQAAAEALAARQSDRALGLYRRKLAGVFSELGRSRRLRRFAYAKRLQPRFREKLAASKRLRDLAFALLEGNTTYAALEKEMAARAAKRLRLAAFGWLDRPNR